MEKFECVFCGLPIWVKTNSTDSIVHVFNLDIG